MRRTAVPVLAALFFVAPLAVARPVQSPGLAAFDAAEPERFSPPAWIIANQHMGGVGSVSDHLDSITANLAGLEANLSALESALTTSTSSGGGFSGGSSGGASGGGSSGAS